MAAPDPSILVHVPDAIKNGPFVYLDTCGTCGGGMAIKYRSTINPQYTVWILPRLKRFRIRLSDRQLCQFSMEFLMKSLTEYNLLNTHTP